MNDFHKQKLFCILSTFKEWEGVLRPNSWEQLGSSVPYTFWRLMRKEGIILFVLVLLHIVLRMSTYSNKKNGSHPNEFFRLIEMSNGCEVCVVLISVCGHSVPAVRQVISLLINFQWMGCLSTSCKVYYAKSWI